MRKVLAILATTSFVSGCSLLFDHLKPESIASLQLKDIPAEQRWWEIFNDLVMNQLAEKLLEQNLDIKIARARLEEANSLLQVATSGLFPDITAAGSLSRTNNQIGFTKPGSISQAGVDMSWKVDVFGQTRSYINATEYYIEACLASVQDIINFTLADLFKTVVEWRQAKQKYKQINDLLETQNKRIELLTSQVDAGLVDNTLLERAQAQCLQTAVQLPLVHACIEEAQHKIERLVGKSSEELSHIFNQPFQELLLPNASNTLEIKMEVIRSRPDIRSARAEMLAIQSDLIRAEADLWPQISIGSFFGVKNISGKIAATDNPVWSLTSSIIAPILNFGKLRGAVNAANARAKQATLGYENKVLNALQEAKTTLSAYINGLKSVNAQQIALTHYLDNTKLTRERFKLGLIDMLKFIDAQEDLDQANITLSENKACTAITFIRLQQALGITFQKAQESF
jgi:NodT family efflux transporter outer membrane factor (OMF) lipoprotein